MIIFNQTNMKQRTDQTLNDVLPNATENTLLTNEEELALVAQIKNGDADAAERFKLQNLRFVVSVAKQHMNQGLTLEQLIEAGNQGLMKAAEKFDEKHGFKFIAYAVWWIRQSILQALAATEQGEPIPSDDQLTARERGILRSIEDGESLAQIAADRHLTEERLRQIINRINKKIQNHE